MTEKLSIAEWRTQSDAPTRKNKAVEGSVSNQIRGWLNDWGIYSERLQSGKVRVTYDRVNKDGRKVDYSNWINLCERGTPDILIIYEGFAIFCETKQPGKTATTEQAEYHEYLRGRAKAKVFVADSLADFKVKFLAIKKEIDG